MDSSDDHFSEPNSSTGAVEEEGELSERDIVKEKDLDQEISSLEDNPFAGTRTKPASKVSVKLLADECLCEVEKLNLTITEGYPSCSSETSGLLKNQFVKTPKTL